MQMADENVATTTDKRLEYVLMARNDFGDKFIRLLDLYRKPDGSRWTMKEIEQSTGGFLKGSYLANLKAGRIRQPGLDRLRSIASVMGFPVELWLQRLDFWEITDAEPARDKTLGPGTLAKNLNLLFNVLTNERTGKPYTEKDVAVASEGELTEQDVRAIRESQIDDLRGAQYLALSKVFGIDINYWYQGTGSYRNLSETDLKALEDAKTHTILNKVYGSPERQKDVVLHLLEQMELIREEERPDGEH